YPVPLRQGSLVAKAAAPDQAPTVCRGLGSGAIVAGGLADDKKPPPFNASTGTEPTAAPSRCGPGKCGSSKTAGSPGRLPASIGVRADQRTEVIALRFCAQACSLDPVAVGRSLP